MRFGGKVPKPLAELDGKAVIARTLDVFARSDVVDGIVLVAHPDWLADHEKLVQVCEFGKVRKIVAGGATRTQSVRNGLAALPADAGVVIVHDGARPLVTEAVIQAGLEAVKATGAAVAGVPVKPTIKVVDPRARVVSETLDRDLLWEIQTPQVFDRRLLDRAYAQDTDGATDDAALVERLGIKVNVFMGAYTNVKITTPEDMVVAAAFLKL